jgi:hypothetical protein
MPEPKEPPSSEVQAAGHVETDETSPERGPASDPAAVDNE